jgi:hypothetical protein
MTHRPNLISAYRLANGDFNDNACQLKTATWAIARPITMPTLRQRITWAWRVFTGRYDALVWPGQE